MSKPKKSEFTCDAKQREIALDISCSFIIQAPAGSGKTTLLVQRYLALLASVKYPEEIIAITFTRKAAGEMQNRILDSLIKAQQTPDVINDKTLLLAQKALHRDQTEKWNLLQNPRRLRIQTIDSLCSYIVSQAPIASGMYGKGEIVPTEIMEKYYRQAAENLLKDMMNEENNYVIEQQKHQHSQTHTPLANLLLHLNNDQEYLIGLFIDMLKKREQWLPHIIDSKQQSQTKNLRYILEHGLQNSILESLEKCRSNFPKELLAEIEILINFAISNIKNSDNSSLISQCANLSKKFLNEKSAPTNDNINIWLGLCEFLLTKNTTKDRCWRKNIDIRQGFPSKDYASSKEEKQLFAEMKERMKQLLAHLEPHEEFRQTLLNMQTVPSPTYSDAQWQALYSLLEILPLLAAQLKLIFQTKGVTDYNEIAMACDRTLGHLEAPSELALNLDYRIKHLLVDEFQDTSQSQYYLLEKLTAGWENGDGRTLFLVGDPMQSIYRFRQAEVGLFLRAQNNGVGNITLKPLQLTANFRSHSKIINWLNTNFINIFPKHPDLATGSIPFTPCDAEALNSNNHNNSEFCKMENLQRITMKVLVNGNDENEANEIINKIKYILQHSPKKQPNNIAILLQTRTHAASILKALKNERIPYQAIEIETLKSSIVIQDLFALTRALIDLSDKIAWLAILRAPWCGLSLNDLYIIAASDSPIVWQNICNCQNCNILKTPYLSSDGNIRLKRLINAITPALNKHEQSNLRNWIEQTWLRLGAPASYEDNSLTEDAEKYFTLLEKYSANNSAFDLVPDINILKQQLENSYLSVNCEDAQIQIMTIHKAKGLEFEHVIIAGLNHKTQNDTDQLILWSQQPRTYGSSDLLLAPIKEAIEKESKIYQHLKTIEQKKNHNELGRLLYVAATRAKQSLHFFAAVNHDDNKNNEKTIVLKPAKNTLLEYLWTCFSEDWLDYEYSKTNETINNETKNIDENKIIVTRLSNDWQSPINLNNVFDPNNNNTKSSFSFILQNDDAARLGTIIHKCLKKLAQDVKCNYFNFTNIEKYIASQKPCWKKFLFQEGFYQNHSYYFEKIALALNNIQQDPIGNWIMSSKHYEAYNEYAITIKKDVKKENSEQTWDINNTAYAAANNEFQNLVIDRTFIDENNKRWIIDYKTSLPNNNIKIEEFLNHELAKYQNQLEQYALAFSKIDNLPIWLGLYFPMCKGWKQWKFSSLRSRDCCNPPMKRSI